MFCVFGVFGDFGVLGCFNFSQTDGIDEWFSVILRLNAQELLAFVYIFVEQTLPRQSPIANRVLHKRQRKLIDVTDRQVMIFLTTYFRTPPMADVNFTSLVTSLIMCHHSVSFTVALVICKLQRILKGFTSLLAQRVFNSMTRIMQPANRGLACRRYRIPSHFCVGLFRAAGRRADYFRLQLHEYMRAIQPCQLRTIRHSLSADNARMLVHALVSTQVDYCNSILYQVAAVHLRPLQSVSIERRSTTDCQEAEVRPHHFDSSWWPTLAAGPPTNRV